MQRRTAIGLLLLVALFVTVSSPGTPVAGDDTLAAQTAGITLGTAPLVRAAPVATPVLRFPTAELLSLLALLCLLLVRSGGGAAALLARPTIDLQSIHRRAGRAERGPPVTV